jgi:hypothetical protein
MQTKPRSSVYKDITERIVAIHSGVPMSVPDNYIRPYRLDIFGKQLIIGRF